MPAPVIIPTPHIPEPVTEMPFIPNPIVLALLLRQFGSMTAAGCNAIASILESDLPLPDALLSVTPYRRELLEAMRLFQLFRLFNPAEVATAVAAATNP